MCLLESETKDVELRRECITTLGYVSQAQLGSAVIPSVITTINQVTVSYSQSLHQTTNKYTHKYQPGLVFCLDRHIYTQMTHGTQHTQQIEVSLSKKHV